MTDLSITTEEVRHDYSVYVDWLYLDRREAFDRWLAEDRRRNRASGWSEGYRRGRDDHCDNGGDTLGEPCDVSSTNPHWLFA
jgi:hypothetical protein